MKENIKIVIRFLVALVSIVNILLSLLGKNPLPFSDSQVYEIISIVVTVLSIIWTAWKNNSVTAAAKVGDKVMTAIKNNIVTVEQIEDFLINIKK